MKSGKFVQIATATLTQSAGQLVIIYALDDQGNVWKCVEGPQPQKPKWMLTKYELQE